MAYTVAIWQSVVWPFGQLSCNDKVRQDDTCIIIISIERLFGL
jgi:hypothetical protein